MDSLQKSNTDFTVNSTRKEEEIRTLESTVYDLRSQVNNLRSQLHRSQETVSYQPPSFQLTAEISDLKHKITTLETQIEFHKKERSNTQSENDRLRSKIHTLEEALHQTETESDRLRSRISSLEKLIERTRQEQLNTPPPVAASVSPVNPSVPSSQPSSSFTSTSVNTDAQPAPVTEETLRLRAQAEEQHRTFKSQAEDYENRIFLAGEELAQITSENERLQSRLKQIQSQYELINQQKTATEREYERSSLEQGKNENSINYIRIKSSFKFWPLKFFELGSY